MKHLSLLGVSLAAIAMAACGGTDTPAQAQDAAPEAPAPVADTTAGTADLLADVATASYSLESNHAFLTFIVGHNGGISDYRVDFTDFAADLDFDASAPENSTLSVTVNPAALLVNYPGDYAAGHADSGYDSWAEDMARNPRWLNADEHPEITFTSTSVSLTGADTGEVTGDLAFLGVTQPVTLDVTFNGVANAPWFGERDLIGFNATTTINRSEFGMGAYIPNITDEVEISFSGEFLQDE